jgi:hypothetical protein
MAALALTGKTSLHESELTSVGNPFTLVVPPRSMTAVVLPRPQQP